MGNGWRWVLIIIIMCKCNNNHYYHPSSPPHPKSNKIIQLNTIYYKCFLLTVFLGISDGSSWQILDKIFYRPEFIQRKLQPPQPVGSRMQFQFQDDKLWHDDRLLSSVETELISLDCAAVCTYLWIVFTVIYECTKFFKIYILSDLNGFQVCCIYKENAVSL